MLLFASPPAEQESGIAHLGLKYVSTTVPNFLKHPRKSTNSSFYGQLRDLKICRITWNQVGSI